MLKTKSERENIATKAPRRQGRRNYNPVIFTVSVLFIFCISGFGFGEEAKPAPAQADLAPFSSATVQFDFANGLFSRKLYSEAVSEYDSFIKRFPNDPRLHKVLIGKAESLFALGKIKEAEKEFRTFLQQAPNDPQAAKANLRIGCCLLQEKSYAAAIEIFDAILKQPSSEEITLGANYYLGRACEDSGQINRARAAFEKSATGKGEFRALSLYSLGELEHASKNDDKAEKLFSQFLSEFPSHRLVRNARIRRAETMSALGKVDEAEKEYLDLASSRNPEEAAQALFGLGWIQVKKGLYDAAVSTARNAMSGASKDLLPDLHYLCGAALLSAKKYEEAERELSQVKNGRYAAEAILKRAWSYLGLAQLPEAEALANQYLKSFPNGDKGSANYVLGIILFRKASYPQAAECLMIARESNSSYKEEAAYQLGLALERKGDDQNAAEAYGYFARNFTQSGKLADACLGQGNALSRLKQFEKAIQAFDKVGKIKNATLLQKEMALSEQAVCWYELRKYKEMDACYSEILQKYPHSSTAAEALYWTAWYRQYVQEYAKAAERYKEFIEKYPKHTNADRARYRLGMSLYQSGNEDGSAEIFYDILLNYPQIEIGQSELLWLGSHFMRKNDFTKSGQVYNALLKRHPSGKLRAMTLYYLAENKRKEKDYEQAIENYKRLVTEKDQRFRSLANYGLGVCYRETGKLKMAREAFQDVTFPAEDPMNAALNLEYGLLENDLGNADEAVRRLMHAGLLYDDMEVCGQALFSAGMIFEKRNMPDKAIICYEELAGKKPGTYGAKYADKSSWSKRASDRLTEIKK